jgi:hypothetical protein
MRQRFLARRALVPLISHEPQAEHDHGEADATVTKDVLLMLPEEHYCVFDFEGELIAF